MMYVGIDLHRRRSHIVALEEDGSERLSRRIGNDPAAFLGLLGELEGEVEVALEAAYGWEWLADLLDEAGVGLHLAHPLGTKAIAAARVKTDAVDAATLAHLLRCELLPEAYVAPRELRDLRELLRHRIAITQLRTALKNRVHALLARHGVPVRRSDLFGRGGRAFLAGLPLREPQRRRIESLLVLIDAIDGEVAQAAAEIELLARADPRVEVLTQLPGIGRYTALLVIAEVGEVGRFPGPRQLCSYAGLAPRVRSSDAKTRLGHISRQGSPHLRWALVEAAQHAARAKGPLRASFEQIARRRGTKVAKVALARKLLTLCYFGLRDGEIRCLAQGQR
jgi:transposase